MRLVAFQLFVTRDRRGSGVRDGGGWAEGHKLELNRDCCVSHQSTS